VYTKAQQDKLLEELGPEFKPFGTLPSEHDIDVVCCNRNTLRPRALGFDFQRAISFPYSNDVTIKRFTRNGEVLEVWTTRLSGTELRMIGEKLLALAEVVE
jgi:hypothetical protein